MPTVKFTRVASVVLAPTSQRFFLEAYERRATQKGGEIFSWPLNVAVNLFDEDTWFENLQTVIDQAKTVRAFAPDSRLEVAATFNAPYVRAVPASRANRQFAAAWVVAAMANFVRAGVDKVAFDLTDDRPAAVLHEFAHFAGRAVVSSQSSDNGARRRVEMVAVRDENATDVFFANTTDHSQSVVVRGLPGLKGAVFSHLVESGLKCFEPAPSPQFEAGGWHAQLSPYEVCRWSFVEVPPIHD